jgi:hypothetical protein
MLRAYIIKKINSDIYKDLLKGHGGHNEKVCHVDWGKA